MKGNIICGLLAVVIYLLTPSITQAQGTIYVSSLSQTSTGSPFVGSDSWLAAPFRAGDNADGYMLGSIQLGMSDASGNPSDFRVMLYGNDGNIAGALPGSSLATLSGSLSPVAAGIYTYSPAANITLLPSTDYFIVLTAGTTIANGAYSWSESSYPPSINNWFVGNGILRSSDGTAPWSTTPYLGIAQFAIAATPIPEPGVLSLLSLGALSLFGHRRKAKIV